MRKILYALIAVVAVTSFVACNDDETYADKLKRERRAIGQYIADSSINVISESQFYAQDSTTNVENNEYVLFSSSGVYMQIVRKGTGEKLRQGETATLLCRYTEWNLLTDSIQSTNDYAQGYRPDAFTVTNTSGTFQNASFLYGQMYSLYSSAAVPTGWLVPLTYIRIGRQTTEEGEIAKVKLIVPASAGQSNASSNTYPCAYTITYQRGR